jgi:alkanesulfonate monooxygenase SsuD/methylene tetrahydromethanopterin reductase-like flavin-dependent oxidoreductase (luciferase family)
MRPLELGLLSLGDCAAEPAAGEQPPAERQRAVVEEAVIAEAAGFDAVWLGEPSLGGAAHASPTVLLAAIAARTEDVRIGASVTLLANLDPLRVAEDYATVDAISDGRVELAAGRGVLADTGDASGRGPDESRERLRENVELLLRLWSETEVAWSGRFRTPLDGVTVEPRPVQRPRPPVWIACDGSHDSVDLAAELGLPLLLPSALVLAFAPLVERYRERWHASGRDAGAARIGCCHPVHVRPVAQEAREVWGPYYLNYLRFADRAGAGRKSAARIDPRDERALASAAICGSPAEVADRIAAARAALGLDLHLSIFDAGGLPPAEVARAIELFAAEVLPALRS